MAFVAFVVVVAASVFHPNAPFHSICEIVPTVNSTFSTFNSFLNSNLLQNVEKARFHGKRDCTEKIDCAENFALVFVLECHVIHCCMAFCNVVNIVIFLQSVFVVVVVVVEMWHSFRPVPPHQKTGTSIGRNK